jgi:hypothetical protein
MSAYEILMAAAIFSNCIIWLSLVVAILLSRGKYLKTLGAFGHLFGLLSSAAWMFSTYVRWLGIQSKYSYLYPYNTGGMIALGFIFLFVTVIYLRRLSLQ